jgi:biotin carboxyl carrier protein
MSALLKLFTVSLLLSGCVAQAQNSTPPPTPSSFTPIPSPTVSPTQRTGRFKLQLTLTAPEDLKVKEGDTVLVGQVLSDRTRERQRLENQRAQVEIQIERLKQPPIKPLAPKQASEMASLPPPNLLQEVAEIDRLQLTFQQVEQRWLQQQQKLAVLDSMQAEIPSSTIPHEQEVGRQRERDVKQAKSDLELAKAKLERAKSDYQREQYENSLERGKRDIELERQRLEYQRQMQEWEKQERDRTFQLSQVNIQLQNLDTQLNQLSQVKAPYAGKVQRVRWEGQNDKNLSVELTLITADLRTRPGTDKVTRSEGASNSNPEASPITTPTFDRDSFTR